MTELSCSICLHRYSHGANRPIICVPCGHTFCGACIYSWMLRGSESLCDSTCDNTNFFALMQQSLARVWEPSDEDLITDMCRTTCPLCRCGVQMVIRNRCVQDQIAAEQEDRVESSTMEKLQERTVTVTRGPFLGLKLMSTVGRCGCVVFTVFPNSEASKVGLQPHDVILAVDWEPLTCAQECFRLVRDGKPGTKCDLLVYRKK